jgi:alpha-amylase
MKPVRLIVALHHHQPVGNSVDVLEECHARTYQPLLEAIEQQPEMSFVLHYSGPLLDFFKRYHPDFLDRIHNLLDQKRVEMLSGGFYEPVLPDLLEADQLGQIRKMNHWLEQAFGIHPKGCWLAEGVLGMEFFYRAGLKMADMTGHYLTTYHNDKLCVFPGNHALRSFFKGDKQEEFWTYLKRQANRDEQITLVTTINVDKWGNLPGTQCHAKETFPYVLGELCRERDWVQLITFEEYFKNAGARARIDLAGGITAEMSGWSLQGRARTEFLIAKHELQKRHDADRFWAFFQAGSWSGFRNRYKESLLMRQKQHRMRELIHTIQPQNDHLLDLLWSAQCNTAYWYGEYGGIYIPELRAAIWNRLLTIEEELRQTQLFWQVDRRDLDSDGENEIQCTNSELCVVFKPNYGGCCTEFSHLRSHTCLNNVLTRLDEREDVSALEGSQPSYDWYSRHMAQDHVFARGIRVENLEKGTEVELGDFVNQPFTVTLLEDDGQSVKVQMEREGGLYRNQIRQSMLIRKTFKLGRDHTGFELSYEIVNTSEMPLSAIWATEWNLLLDPRNPSRDVFLVDDQLNPNNGNWQVDCARELTIESPRTGLRWALQMDQPAMIWSYPIQHEWQNSPASSPERQGNAFLIGHELDLPPKSAFYLTIRSVLHMQ